MNKKSPNKEKLFTYLSITLIIVIVILGLLYIFLSSESNANNNQNILLATEYKNVTTTDGYQIFTEYNNSYSDDNNKVNNLTIIDARRYDYSCTSCLESAYRRAHIPGAILDKNLEPEKFYNRTTDILVYTHDGSHGHEYVEQLKGHIYGKIYFLKGGYMAWKEEGYDLEEGSSSD